MWASAATVAFYVVDRLLIRPLKLLRSGVATYQPGSARLSLSRTPAIEIRELETSFTAFADRLAERERDLERALADQVRLTREVHHRVKNNLQVIASLISLHARDSVSTDAGLAYASIQRRVDALAIVHRNHYAELEQNQGIDVKALLSELIGNFRANPKPASAAPSMTLASSPLYVAQDTAIPLAFLFTEIAELALFADPTAPIVVTIVTSVNTDAETASLDIASTALKQPNAGDRTSALRIIEGLARQLRAPMQFDAARHAYSIAFATIPAPDFS
jgi:two-component sensor histidine kinase